MRRRRRRGEGQTEYVIITGLMSVCIVAGLFNFGGEIKRALSRANVCLTCEDDELEDGGKPKPAGDGANEDGEGGEGGEAGEGGENSAPLPWYNDPSNSYYWVAQLMRWFGGAPHIWDYMFA